LYIFYSLNKLKRERDGSRSINSRFLMVWVYMISTVVNRLILIKGHHHTFPQGYPLDSGIMESDEFPFVVFFFGYQRLDRIPTLCRFMFSFLAYSAGHMNNGNITSNKLNTPYISIGETGTF